MLTQRLSVWLEFCDIAAFGVCFHWTTIRAYDVCNRFGPGPLSCPGAGTYNARPGPGKYRTKIFGEAQDTLGGYGSGNAYGTEVILN